jgi:3-phosphoshikimate 1-carboxyvinyltransferase
MSSNNLTLSSYNDHRIVMALTIFALLNKGEITIKDVECINKSDPNFFNLLIKGCKENSIIIK